MGSDSSSSILKDHKLFIKLIVNTNDYVQFSRSEMDNLYEAFKNSKMAEDKKSSHGHRLL